MSNPRPRALALLALCASFLAAPLLAAPATLVASAPRLQASKQPSPPDPARIRSAIDGSVRWLREQQAEDGSYGEGVTGTAWALQGISSSPRKYKRHDGPFVGRALEYLARRQDPESGLIHDEDATEHARLEQAVLALLSLQRFEDAESVAVRERLGAQLAYRPSPLPRAELTREEAAALALRWLEERRADGSYEGPEGAVVETARALVDLARALEVLAPEESAAEPARALPPFSAADRTAALSALRRGALFLVATGPDGRFGAGGGPDAGITAMALAALQALPAPRPEEVQTRIDRGLAWLVSLQKEDGSIHDGKLKNYNTSAAILALARAGRPEHAPVIERARIFLVGLQADEGEGYSDGDLYYGGIGYGNDERPDLSNLQMALEALAAAGTDPESEVFRKALRFLERTQNRSESNDTRIVVDGAVVASGDDGGAAYRPGHSMAGYEELADGTKVPRSYGSMTYALLKCYVLAGLPKEDPRMEAAWKWLCANYSLDVNPGFERSRDPRAPYQGLYYYFHSMARALDLYGEEQVVDRSGVVHPWRAQLAGRVVAMQRRDDGSWVNENSPRWWEGNPVLATAYAMLTLEAALPPPAPEPAPR